MVWAILAALGIPLWLCALGIVSIVLQNRRLREPDDEERKKLHRLDAEPVIAILALSEGDDLEVATAAEQRPSLLGPFAQTPG